MCRLKLSRLFCLLCALSVFFGSFGLSASAASSDNLVDSDLREWESDNPVTQVTERVINGETCYFIFSDSEQIVDTNLNLRYSLVYEIPNLKVGRSYTFNFHLLSAEEVGSANVYGETALYTGYKNGSATMCIGLGSYDATNDWVNFVDNAYIEINKDNYLSYYGTDISIQFELPNIVNPCIFIYYGDTSTSKIDNWVYFKNIELIDNTKAEEDSFFSRLFEWFQEKFDAIGESFANLGNKLTELKDGFINKITELKTSFENKITELKDSFQAKIDELKQGLIDLKDNLIEGIKSLFVPDEAFIATWKEEMELLLQERLGIIWDACDFFIALIQTIGDLLTTTADDIHYELPEMVIELNGQTYTLWQAQQVDFSFLEKNAFFAMLYKLYKTVLNVLLGIPLLNYAKIEMDATLHN